jgi:cyanophycin synthetase
MKAEPALLDQMNRMLAPVVPPDILRLESLDVFTGPIPQSSVPVFRFAIAVAAGDLPLASVVDALADGFPAIFEAQADSTTLAEPEAVASLIARMAAALLDQHWSLGLSCGARGTSDGAAEGWFEYLLEPIGYQALASALLAVGAALGGRSSPTAASRNQRESLEQGLETSGPTVDSQLLLDAARRRNVPAMTITGNSSLWQFGWGRASERFWLSASNADGMVGNRIAADKEVAKRLFRQLGIPTCASQLVGPQQDPQAAAKSIGWPCVVKPLGFGKGIGVTIDIRDPATLDRAVALARRSSEFLVVEAHMPGDDHRLVIVDGELVAAVRREAARVTGDGTHTVAQLLAALNQDRKGPPRTAGFLRPIDGGQALTKVLATQGMTSDTVPEPGQAVRLTATSSWWQGGSGTDVLDRVHPQIRLLAEQLAGVLRLRIAGIDYVTPDITRSVDEAGGAFLEAKTVPGVELLLAAGMDAAAIGDRLLGSKPGRIPVNLVVAADGLHRKLTAMLRERLPEMSGLATTEAIQIGDFAVPANKLSPHMRVAGALRYPTIDQLVVLWRPEDLAEHGLPVDALNTAILLDRPLPDDWLATLARHSQHVRHCEDPAEAVALSLETGA